MIAILAFMKIAREFARTALTSVAVVMEQPLTALLALVLQDTLIIYLNAYV